MQDYYLQGVQGHTLLKVPFTASGHRQAIGLAQMMLNRMERTTPWYNGKITVVQAGGLIVSKLDSLSSVCDCGECDECNERREYDEE